MKTGEVEVEVHELRILNTAKTPPFMLDEFTEVAENIRLKYRYLDLRRPAIQQNLMLRYQVTRTVRRYLDAQGFLDIETPVLTKSTPEGARDYLVPSRVNPGTFYALPQSPQLFKQLLMVSGFDRYFQIVQLLPRRGPARRPPARVHPDRLRDELRRPRGRHRRHGGDDRAPSSRRPSASRCPCRWPA